MKAKIKELKRGSVFMFNGIAFKYVCKDPDGQAGCAHTVTRRIKKFSLNTEVDVNENCIEDF